MQVLKDASGPTLVSQGHPGSVSVSEAGATNLVSLIACVAAESITAKWCQGLVEGAKVTL